jgi:hypothetical protein
MAACEVCCDVYTALQRKRIACPRCAYAACARCVRAYLLTQTDPGCMRCHVAWDRVFLDSQLTATWRNGELRRHRERVLFDRERSLLPATQPAVEREAEQRARAAARREVLRRIKELQTELREARKQCYELSRVVRRPANERRSFVAACPGEACRGFLSDDYKCGTCLKQYCSKCRCLPGDEHVCDPEVVETLRAIARESRPCPGCGMAISRVSGCDQMYCTQCDTPFSYSTGQRVSGVIHNPHYFERLRQLRESAVNPCADGDVWPEFHLLPYYLRIQPYMSAIYQAARHVERVVLHEIPAANAVRENEDLRIAYCLKDIDETKFRQRLQRRERARELNIEKRQILETFVLVALEFFTRPPHHDEAERLLRQQLERVVNAPLRELADRYGNRMPQLTDQGYSSGAYDPRAGLQGTKRPLSA